MNTAISGNAIEGARFRVEEQRRRHLAGTCFLTDIWRMGQKDEKLKYDALVEYSFNDRKEYRKEFPLNSIRLEYMYDINQLGQQYMYASKDNMFLAWKRRKDTRATYLRQAELTYYHEHYNGPPMGLSSVTVANMQPNMLYLTGSDRMEPLARSRVMI